MSIPPTYARERVVPELDPGFATEPLEPNRAAAPQPSAQSRGRPHVCFVAPLTWPVFSGARDIPVIGGAELQQSLVAAELARRGFRVSMISLDYGQADGAVVKGVTVYKMYKPDAGIPVVRYLHPRLTTLWRTLARVDAEIYYYRSAAATAGFMAHFCRRHGKRSVYGGASDHDFIPGRQDIAYARDRWVFEYGVRNVDRVFVQNQTQLENLRGNFGRDGVVVPNCYTPPEGARADRQGYVLWVASIRAAKRPEYLLEIARRLPQYRFVMVGGADSDRRMRPWVEMVRATVKSVPNIDYRGFVPFEEADRLFDGARVVLSTSRYEGFPNIFLQAWSRGVPTVAFVDTRSRAPDGLPVYDIVGDLDGAARRVERLMRDAAAWETASARVQEEFGRRHSIEAAVNVFERELEALAAAR